LASFETTLRQRLEDLILGTVGTTRTVTPGRFALHALGGTLEDQPDDSAERKLEVVLRRATGGQIYNPIDGFQLTPYDVTFRLTYTLTNAGGNLVESSAEQGGPGTVDAIRDRAESDRVEIARVVSWHENTSGVALTGCTMIGAYENLETSPSGVFSGGKYIYEFFYRMMANVTMGSSAVTS